jgi:hypothetical protein
MTDDTDTNLPATTPKRSPPGKVGGRLKQCIDAMVWRNLTDNEAAVEFKMHVTSIRKALKLPHVLRYLKEQREVLHARELARNSHTLIDVRDNSPNGMARIAAVRELERASDEGEQRGAIARSPGFVIVVNPPAEAMPVRHTAALGPVITVAGSVVGSVVGRDDPESDHE